MSEASTSGLARESGRNTKRALSTADEPTARRIRPRLSPTASFFRSQGSPYVPFTRTRSLHLGRAELPGNIHRPLTRSLSYSAIPRNGSLVSPTSADAEYPSAMSEGLSMIRRSVSISESLRSVATVTYPETSAHNFLRNTKVTVDFSPPSTASVAPIASSPEGILFFTRGNRVHLKNFDSGDIVSQLCRIPDNVGELRAIECATGDQPNLVAIGTSQGYIQIYDVSTKKKTCRWTTKSLSSMAWNRSVLSVGTANGTIRHFDLRLKETSKMKEQAKKLTRHQSTICSLKWNVDGKFLASGDESGNVYCWDSRQNIPLDDVGEVVQRRKKMQHPGPVTALAWCPWKPKILATGDSANDGTGILRVWNIGADTSTAYPAAETRQLNAQITSIQWSTTCKELLTTHGPGKIADSTEVQTQDASSAPAGDKNSITVHSYSSLRQVARTCISTNGVGSSTLNSNGTKVIVAVPAEGKLKMCEVWGKAKEVKRQPSFMDHNSIR